MLTFIYLGMLFNPLAASPVLSVDTIWERSCDQEHRGFVLIDDQAGSRPPEMDIDVDDMPEYTEI